MAFLDDAACSSQPCKEGKELSDRCNSPFTCRHIELVKKGPACPPQSPILCESIRYTHRLVSNSQGALNEFISWDSD